MQKELHQTLEPAAVTTVCAGGSRSIVSENEDFEKKFFETELYRALFAFADGKGVANGARSRFLYTRLPLFPSAHPLTA